MSTQPDGSLSSTVQQRLRRRTFCRSPRRIAMMSRSSQGPGPLPAPIDPGADAGARATREAARSAAITTTRASILAALAGVGGLVTIAINYRNSSIANETFRISERGHLTDRYAKAIELLGDTNSIAIRLGGIYALQQFASDTRRPEDQNTVVEVLSAFVRLNLATQPAAAPPPLPPDSPRDE